MSNLKLVGALLGVIDYAENETLVLQELIEQTKSSLGEPQSTEEITRAYEAIDELFLTSTDYDHSWKTTIDYLFEEHPDKAPAGLVFAAACQEIKDLFGFSDIQAVCLANRYYDTHPNKKSATEDEAQ